MILEIAECEAGDEVAVTIWRVDMGVVGVGISGEDACVRLRLVRSRMSVVWYAEMLFELGESMVSRILEAERSNS